MDTLPKAFGTWLRRIKIRLAMLRIWAQRPALDISLSRIKIALEIIAIPVVAYWAFTRFSAEEAPALEHRARIQGELSWQKYSDKH